MLNFTITDEYGKEVDLVEGGSSIEVNKNNKIDYISAFIDQKLEKSFKDAVLPFRAGNLTQFLTYKDLIK